MITHSLSYILYSLSVDDFSRILQKQIGKEVLKDLSNTNSNASATVTNDLLYSYLRGISTEAQEIGKAVVKIGTREGNSIHPTQYQIIGNSL